jgi:site-specific recombinase XerD
MQSISVLAINDIEELERGFELSLRSRNRAAKTIKSYVEVLRLFREFLVRSGMPTEIDKINREHVEAFIADQLQRWWPKTAHVRYGDLRQFFRWAVDDGEIPASPMINMVPPSLPEVPVPIVSDGDLKKLLNTSEGKTFEKRRDAAVLRVLADCGIRLAESTSLHVDDVDFETQVLHVVGKGSRPRAAPFGAKTGQALDRYLRMRSTPWRGHQSYGSAPKGHSPTREWLKCSTVAAVRLASSRSTLTSSGIPPCTAGRHGERDHQGGDGFP